VCVCVCRECCVLRVACVSDGRSFQAGQASGNGKEGRRSNKPEPPASAPSTSTSPTRATTQHNQLPAAHGQPLRAKKSRRWLARRKPSARLRSRPSWPSLCAITVPATLPRVFQPLPNPGATAIYRYSFRAHKPTRVESHSPLSPRASGHVA
jgi:hypothetical protein